MYCVSAQGFDERIINILLLLLLLLLKEFFLVRIGAYQGAAMLVRSFPPKSRKGWFVTYLIHLSYMAVLSMMSLI